MRERSTDGNLSLHCISGTHVTLVAINIQEESSLGDLIGFSIDRLDHASQQVFSLSSRPIQKFLWGDYTCQPAQLYTYTVRMLHGTLSNFTPGNDVSVEIMMEDPREGKHGIYFNRGVAASQMYSERFSQYRQHYLVDKFGRESWREFIKPDNVPNDEAFVWLSRGLEEALLKFIRQAKGPRYKIRASLYELTYAPVIQAFADCVESGADVKIVHHYKETAKAVVKRDKIVTDENGKIVKEMVPDSTAKAATAAIRRIGIKDAKYTNAWQNHVFIKRKNTAAISHNKFIILLEDEKPVQLWTGSTNLTAGGIFGQSNVGHIVSDKSIAATYLTYWEKLCTDPKKARKNSQIPSDPTQMGIDQFIEEQEIINFDDGPIHDASTNVIFSPRSTTDVLRWYADRISEARSSIHFTAAFGVCEQISEEFNNPGPSEETGEPFLRHILLESHPSKKKSDTAKEKARDNDEPLPIDFFDFKSVPANSIAFGDIFNGRDKSDCASITATMLQEYLSGLNSFVDYIHTKYVLIDPLSSDPTVITGSANFSSASTDKNDENMLVIRGDLRVADIYLTEFMRIFNHFHSRNQIRAINSNSNYDDSFHCGIDASWTIPYYNPKHHKFQERLLFM